ncbi:MAG TPA: hypothetical protein VHO06_15895 [Polyangia bacterium]|nr:hypothetical protein [Polyangia bacterium]
MKSTLAYLTFTSALALVMASAGCTIVTPDSPDGGNKTKTKIVILPPPHPDALPPPPPLQANVLYVVNLARSSANLAGSYAGIMIGIDTYFQSKGLVVANMGVISTYADQFGPRLLLGQQAGAPTTPPSALAALLLAAGTDGGVSSYQDLLPLIAPTLGNIDDADLALALQLLASSGDFDGDAQTSEAANVIGFGQGLNAIALPPELGGIDRSAFFDTPHDLFIVVYLQPLPRRCALSSAACAVNGRSPTDIFLDTNADGTASWLSFASGGIAPSRVVQAAIATPELESQADFEAACKQVQGVPLNDLDVMGPSPNAYFGPLMAALDAANPGTGQSADFCTLIGGKPQDAITALATGIAAVAH